MNKGDKICTINGIDFFYGGWNGNGWHHCCDLVDAKSNDSVDMLSGYGIDSALNLVDTVMDLCKDYE